MKLVDDQGIVSPWTLASLYDEDIITICNMIFRPGGLVSGKTPDKGGTDFHPNHKESQIHGLHV